jgi:sugar phosphate isomerase/epimerase
MIDRRTFIGTLAAGVPAVLAVPRLVSAMSASAKRLPLGFSTLGCPTWDWRAIVDFASAHEFSAIELRGIKDAMDLTKCPEFQPGRIAETMRDLEAHGLVISDLGASTNLHEAKDAAGAAGMAEARSFIDLAAALHVPYIRVFGNKFIAGIPREQTLERVGAALRVLGEYAREKNVVVLVETHGDFTDSPTVREIIQRADSKGAAVLWDAHHTFAFGKEEPEASVRMLGSLIRHTHLKDSVPSGTDRKYVLTGTGEVPVRRQVQALANSGYKGFYNFEWEKRWHPEIEEPDVAFAQYRDVVSGYMRDAGIATSI